MVGQISHEQKKRHRGQDEVGNELVGDKSDKARGGPPPHEEVVPPGADDCQGEGDMHPESNENKQYDDSDKSDNPGFHVPSLFR